MFVSSEQILMLILIIQYLSVLEQLSYWFFLGVLGKRLGDHVTSWSSKERKSWYVHVQHKDKNS